MRCAKHHAARFAMVSCGVALAIALCWLLWRRSESSQSGFHPLLSLQALRGRGAPDEVAYWEPVGTNPTRALARMCVEIERFNASRNYDAALGTLRTRNAAHPLSEAALVKKVKVWPLGRRGFGPRLLCLTFGYAGRPGESESAQRLWGAKCDGNYLYTDAAAIPGLAPGVLVPAAPLGGNAEANGWQRLRGFVAHVAKTGDLAHYDWFLFASDQSYVVVENARKLLAEPHVQYLSEMGTPIVIGHRMVTGGKLAFVSHCTFLLNRAAMRILSVGIELDGCKPKLEGAAMDLCLAECLREFNVNFFDSADEFGEDRIHIFHPELLAMVLKNPNGTQWYVDYHHRQLPTGLEAVSEYTVSFNYMTPFSAHELHKKLFP